MKTQETQKKRPPRQVGMSWLTSYLTVRNVSKAMDFYEKAFGFEKGHVIKGQNGKIEHGEMKYEDLVVVMLGLEGTYHGEDHKAPVTSKADCPVNLYVYCSDVDEMCSRAKQAGAKITTEPANMFWGDRIVQFNDPDGYHWTFATNVADFDLSKATKNG